MKLEEKIAKLENKIKTIEERNKRVEADKAWEISWIRKIIIAILTYLIIVSFFLVNNLPNPFVNAIVPTLGFILSTLTLNIFKHIWINLNGKKIN